MSTRKTINVTFADKQWAIPPLPLKCTKIIDPMLLSLFPLFQSWNDNIEKLPELDGEIYDKMLTVIFTAVSFDSPDLKREAFDELHITVPEMITACTLIGRQTGLFMTPKEVEAITA